MLCVRECPKCGSDTNVINTRKVTKEGVVIRLRKCTDCKYMFETSEIPSSRLQNIKELSRVADELTKENMKLRMKLTRIEQFMTKELFPKEEQV